MLITSKARLSLIKRFKETQPEEEYRNLVYLFKYNDRLKKSKRRHKKEILAFNKDLKELLETHEPFLQTYEDPQHYEGDDEYILEVKRKSSVAGGVIQYRNYLANYWDEEKQIRVTCDRKCYILKTDEGLTEFIHPDESPMPNAVKVLWFFLKPEFQGNYFKTKKLIRLSFDCLINDSILTMFGTTSQAEQTFYPFANKGQEKNMLSNNNDSDYVNNLQRMYVASGAIAVGDQVYWFTPTGVQLWLNRSDSREFRNALVQIRKNKKNIFTAEERDWHGKILEAALI
jgi:hypothetical protein